MKVPCVNVAGRHTPMKAELMASFGVDFVGDRVGQDAVYVINSFELTHELDWPGKGRVSVDEAIS